MESLRINNKNLYRIEVNDKGEFIEFDLEDIGLQIKLYEALEEIKNIETECKQKEIEMLKEVIKENNPIGEKTKEFTLYENEIFQKMRNAMDKFLGNGACQKIFGDKNYYEMFNDLLKELTKKRKEFGWKSHFDMMQLTSNNINKRIMDKYNKNKKNVI